MKILFKFPIRSRFDKFFKTLDLYYKNILNENFQFLITIDEDDKVLNCDEFKKRLGSYKNLKFNVLQKGNKIKAINFGIENKEWDICVIVSDDMIPQVYGFDEIIRDKMKENFPDLDGCLWFNDGYKTNEINTLAICGRKYFDRFGYVYHEDYISQRADIEYQEVAQKLGKIKYFDEVIIRHEHPENVFRPFDSLLIHNYQYCKRDENVYYYRKSKGFPIGIPKIAHFIWGAGTKLSYFRYLTYKTFKDLHPDWKIYFYNVVGTSKQKTWTGTERLDFMMKQKKDYTDRIESNEWEVIDLFEVTRLKDITPNYTSDLVRWYVLYLFGGFYFDLDQIFLRSFNDFTDYDIVWGGDYINYSGVVGMFRRCPHALKMFRRTERAISKAIKYCDAGNWLWDEYVKQIFSENQHYQYKIFQTPQNYFYPVPESYLMKDFYLGELKPDLSNSYSLHWFGGHPDSQEFNKKSEEEIIRFLCNLKYNYENQYSGNKPDGL